jgi:phospholipid/cholesterol/gamma-HCH transport system substrate-binding protein
MKTKKRLARDSAMPTYKRNILVGATVLGAILGFVWMSLKFSSRAAEIFAPPQVVVHFHCPRADGLSPGSAIEYLGVQVGHVTAVARNSTGVGVSIDALVDSNPPLPANMRAQIVSAGLLGGGSLISMDVDDQQPKGSLKADTTIDAQYVGLQLDLLPPSLTQTAGQIGKMSEELRLTVKQLRESGAITDLDKAINQISAQAGKVGGVFDSLQNVLGDPKTQKDLKGAISDLHTTISKLNSLADGLQTASVDASATIKGAHKDIDNLNSQIGDRLTQISGILMTLQSVLTKVDNGQGTAGQLVNDPRLYQSLVDTSRQLNETVTDLKRLVEQWEQEGVYLKLK